MTTSFKQATTHIAAPNLPIAPNEYNQHYQDQLTNIIRLFFNSIANNINAPLAFGSFYSTDTQTNPVANTAMPVTVNNIIYNNNISIAGIVGNTNFVGSKFIVASNGVYNIQFSLQADKTGGGADALYIWLRVNGVDVPYSAGKVVISGPNAETIPAWNYVITLATNDYFQLMWSSSDTNMVLAASVASSPVPAIPSVIITVVWVSDLINTTRVVQ